MSDQLSAHFQRHEFACHCGCGFDAVSPLLIIVLEHFGAAVTITQNGGCRCKPHNLACDGVEKSQHLLGAAADIVVAGVSPADVADYVDEQWPHTLGLGRYDGFTHVDVRKQRARWNKRKGGR